MARRKRRARPRQQEESNRNSVAGQPQRVLLPASDRESPSRMGTHHVTARSAQQNGSRSQRVPALAVPNLSGSTAHHTPRSHGSQIKNQTRQIGRGRNSHGKRQQLLDYLHSIVDGGTAQLRTWEVGSDHESDDEECAANSGGKMDWQPEAEIRVVFLEMGAARMSDRRTSRLWTSVGDGRDGACAEHEAWPSGRDELMGRISANGYGVEDREAREIGESMSDLSARKEEVH